jgi:hypothetical protein
MNLQDEDDDIVVSHEQEINPTIKLKDENYSNKLSDR